MLQSMTRYSIAHPKANTDFDVPSRRMDSPRQEQPTREHIILDEAKLAARLAAGDERALGELYDQLGARAYALALAMLREPADAEEIVADTFAQVWRTAGSFDASRGSLVAWVNTITRSRALDRLRARKRRGSMLDRAAQGNDEGLALPLPAPDQADAEAEKSDVGRVVRASLAALPEAQRIVIEMAYFGGLSQSEIAADLREPLGTIKTRMRMGMGKLRQVLIPLRSEVGQ